MINSNIKRNKICTYLYIYTTDQTVLYILGNTIQWVSMVISLFVPFSSSYSYISSQLHTAEQYFLVFPLDVAGHTTLGYHRQWKNCGSVCIPLLFS